MTVMVDDDRGNLRLAIGLTVSVLAHVAVLAPLATVALGGGASGATSAPVVEAPEVAPPEILPGIEQSDAATIDWIGFEAYEEHIARLSEVDQAAFTRAPSEALAAAVAEGDAGTPEAGALVDPASEAVDAPDVTEPLEPAESAPEAIAATEPTRDPIEPADVPVPADSADPAAPPEAGTETVAPAIVADEAIVPDPSVLDSADGVDVEPLILEPSVDAPGLLAPRPTVGEEAVDAEAASDVDETEPRPRLSTIAAPEPRPEPAEVREVDAAEVMRELASVLADFREAFEATSAMAVRVGGEGGDAEQTAPGTVQSDEGVAPPQQGIVADRESQATSTVPVTFTQIKASSPIVREGVTVHTASPVLRTFERVLRGVSRVQVRVTFDRRGLPAPGGIQMRTTTGDTGLDDVVRACFANWRVSGPKLAELPPDGTITMDFTLLLNR